jgi:hypothetical protein
MGRRATHHRLEGRRRRACEIYAPLLDGFERKLQPESVDVDRRRGSIDSRNVGSGQAGSFGVRVSDPERLRIQNLLVGGVVQT